MQSLYKKCFLFGFFIFTLQLNAQKWSVAPEAGLNINMLEKSDIGYNAQLGLFGGGQIRYKLRKNISISSGLYFNQKKISYYEEYQQPNAVLDELFNMVGMTSTGINTKSDVTVTGRVKEHFIEIPILAVYNYKRVNVFGGPYIGYLLFAKTDEVVETRFSLTNAIDFGALLGGDTAALISAFLPPPYKRTTNSSGSSSGLKTIDVGYTFGLGYEYDNLCFNLIYSQGLLDYSSSKSNKHFNIIRFSAAYFFNLKCKKKEAPKDPE